MQKFYFDRTDEDSLILVEAEINGMPISMALDTGASHTTIDETTLMLAGVSTSSSDQTVDIETAKGIIEAKLTKLKTFKSLDKEMNDFEVQTYDFIAAGILSQYNGLIGLDFLQNTHFCIDLQENSISFPE